MTQRNLENKGEKESHHIRDRQTDRQTDTQSIMHAQTATVGTTEKT